MVMNTLKFAMPDGGRMSGYNGVAPGFQAPPVRAFLVTAAFCGTAPTVVDLTEDMSNGP
jgi:hypothetical protein